MSRKFFRRYAPSHQQVQGHRHLKVFGQLLCDPNLWHLNRHSVSGAFGVGLFWAFIPIPMQMLVAAAFAIVLRVNLPISLVLVWVTNPLTMAPIFYISYVMGSWLLDTPPVPDFTLKVEWITHSMSIIWKPLLVGSLVSGLVAGLVGFVAVRLVWRIHLLRYLKQRAVRRRLMRLGRDSGE